MLNANKVLPAILALLLMGGEAVAEPIDVERLANAIYKAENSKTHPYGIMTKYKHTTPRQACINTINRAYRDWKGLKASQKGHKQGFIAFLGARYCPTDGNSLRPAERALNRFWVPNVSKLYNKEIS